MEQFGLWNLLKTMLSTTQSTPQNNDSTPQNTPPSQGISSPPHAETPQSAPQRENACEQFLLRHESLRSKRK